MSLALPATEPLSPRYATARQDRASHGWIDARVAEMCGWELFAWQQELVDVAGEFDPETKLPYYRTVGVSVARQNGKTTVCTVRIGRQLIVPRQTVAYTAQDRTVARTKWEEHVEILMDTPFSERVDRVDRTNHREMLVMENGSRYMPVTPSGKKAGRSLSIDLAIIDEAHSFDSMEVIGALEPTMIARPHAQLWLLSNAGDASSVLWRHYTEVGRREVDNPDSTMCWVEYAAPDDADVSDPDAWAVANPTMDLPGGVLSSALANAATTLDPETFQREHLNLWVLTQSTSGIDPVTWAACAKEDLVPKDKVAFGLDFTPLRDRGTLAVSGLVSGVTPLEILESGTDLTHLVTRAAEVANRWKASIVIDRGSPAGSAIAGLERATAYGKKNRVRILAQTEMVKACGDFYDAALDARLSHRDDPRLNDTITAARRRKVGDTWIWDRHAGADITALTAVTAARWGVLTAEEALKAASISSAAHRRMPTGPRPGGR